MKTVAEKEDFPVSGESVLHASKQVSDCPTGLLVSIRNVDELLRVRSCELDWIDVKEPSFGSLGAPSQPTALAIAAEMDRWADSLTPSSRTVPPRSIALGELRTLDVQLARSCASRFPVCKVGMSETAHSNGRILDSWKDKLVRVAESLAPAKLVVAAYADWHRCSAPSLDEVRRLCECVQSPFFLIDTYLKDGRGLLHWLNVSELADIKNATATIGDGLVLAGSLSIDDLPQILSIAPKLIAVRGGVCDSTRNGEISASKVRGWLEELNRLRLATFPRTAVSDQDDIGATDPTPTIPTK